MLSLSHISANLVQKSESGHVIPGYASLHNSVQQTVYCHDVLIGGRNDDGMEVLFDLCSAFAQDLHHFIRHEGLQRHKQ